MPPDEGVRWFRSVEMPHKPHMAYFAVFLAAAEEGLGFTPGTFMKIYEVNRGVAVESTLEAYPISEYVMKVVGDEGGSWSGTFTALLKKLDTLHGEDKKPECWPKTARKLSEQMKRLAPALRKKGYDCDFSPTKHARSRKIAIIRSTRNTSPSSPSSPDVEAKEVNGGDVCGDVPVTPPPSPTTSPTETTNDSGDVVDGDVEATSPSTSPNQVTENKAGGDVGDVGDVSPVLFKQCPRCGSYALHRTQGNYACQRCGLAEFSRESREAISHVAKHRIRKR